MTDIDHGAVYRGVRERVGDLVADLDDDQLDRIVAATPRWRVRDVVAHLAGTPVDVVGGNLEGVTTDAWTQAQVDARRATPLAEILTEWASACEQFEPMIASFDGRTRAMVLTDAVSHEHDLRGALDRPGARDSEAVASAFAGIVRGVGTARGARGGLTINHDAGQTTVGDGPATSTVDVSRFEVIRAAVGRRSFEQIAAWEWSGEPDVAAMVLPMFTPPRAEPLVE